MSYRPTRKVTALSFAGAVASLALMTISMVHPALEFPPGYEAALTTVICGIVGYVTRDR